MNTKKALNFIARFIAFMGTKLGRLVAVVAAVCLIPAAAIALAFLGLPVAGIHFFDEPAPVVIKKEEPVVTKAVFEETPAKTLFAKTFNTMDKVWNDSPFQVTSAGLPHPLSCMNPAPTVSDSKTYKVSNTDLQVTLAAYPAGLGAVMFDKLKNDINSCKPSGTSLYGYSQNAIGVEAYTFQVAWAGNYIETTMARRGDVIAFVTTDRNADSAAFAKRLDTNLAKLMTPEVCVNQRSSLKDQYRNGFFARKAFTGKVKDQPLTTEKRNKPKLTSTDKAKGIERTPLPAVFDQLPIAVVPSDDYVYPLWPPLPTPVQEPIAPIVPAPQKLTSNAEIRIEDLEGPGCGWAFLETVEPVYSDTKVAQANKKIVNDAQALLDADGDRWVKQVRKYWLQVWRYNKQAAAYKAYVADLQEVTKAWNLIHAAWNQYYTDYANWQTAVSQRKQFLADQQAAEDQYVLDKISCKVYKTDEKYWEVFLEEYPEYLEDDPETWPTLKEIRENTRLAKLEQPSQGQIVAEKPDKTLPPVVEPTYPVNGCPAPKPEILSQEAPPKPVKPTPPADPRPADQRD